MWRTAKTMASAATQAGDDRQQDGLAHPDGRHQREREQRAADRAEVVHGALEAVGAPVGRRRHGVGQERVSRRNPQTARHPGAGAKHPDLPCGARHPDEAREHRGDGVAADGGRPALRRVVGQRTPRELRDAGQAVGDALDQSQRRRRCPQGARQEAGKQRGGDLVPEVGEQARRPDAAHRGREPPVTLGRERPHRHPVLRNPAAIPLTVRSRGYSRPAPPARRSRSSRTWM